MVSQLEQLLSAYEKGSVTRRHLMQALLAMVAAPAAAAAQTSGSTMQKPYYNHVQIIVSDMKRSAEFYQKVLGATSGKYFSVGAKDNVQSLPFGDGSNWMSIRLPNAQSGIRKITSNQVGAVDHFSFGVDNYDAPRILAALKKAGIAADTQGSQGWVWATDPDGFHLQFMDKNARE